MARAIIYCRVSSDSQEREGTSLQTQLENSLNYCQGKAYDVAYRFSEAYSGLSLERPQLDKLRELVRAEAVDVVVCHSLDRYTRDPGHGVILTQELEKHHVTLEAVTEDVSNTELGKLISYIRGFASKLEAEKIRERTNRGRRARAKEGRIPSGSGMNLYGYDYVRVSQENGGRRVINETEASWVRQMFLWLVNEGLSTNAVMWRLRNMNAPTKSGKPWHRCTIQVMLRNQVYAGKTHFFTTAEGRQKYTRPQSDWIEIPEVTPAIISQELFDAAQRQLRVNRTKTQPHPKHEYLLRGHLRCRQCGRAYVGGISVANQNGERRVHRNYRCIGKLRWFEPNRHCHNKGWSADKLERLVWPELERYLSNPELILKGLEAQRHDASQQGAFEVELQRVESQLRAVDRDQHQLLQWALKGFPAEQVEAENKKLNAAREGLKARRTELEAQLEASRNAVLNVANLEKAIERAHKQVTALDFENKRLALDMLGITIYLDGENVEVVCKIEPEKKVLTCNNQELGSVTVKQNDRWL